MKRFFPSLLAIVSILFLLSGCDNKKNPYEQISFIKDTNITDDTDTAKSLFEQVHSTKDPNTTNDTDTAKNPYEKAVRTINRTKSINEEMIVISKESNLSRLQVPNAENFLLANLRGGLVALSVSKDNHLHVSSNVLRSIIVLNFFSPWSHPAKNQLYTLIDLQKKYQKKLHVIEIVLNPHQHADKLKEVFPKIESNLFFVATGKENNAFARAILKSLNLPNFMPTPLTVIYHNGIYYRHYESAVPFEMIDHDIQSIIQ